MKVIHLCPSASFGGAEAVAETLHVMGERAGWTSSLVLPISRDAPAAPVRWRAWALSLRLRADVVHAHLPWPDRLGAVLVATKGLPMVVTFHLLPDGEWPRDRVTALPSRWMLSLSAQRDRTRWVALSQRDRAVLSGPLGDGVRVVRNAPPEAIEVAPLDWPDGAVRLASVGRLHAQKGFDRMLRALAHPSVRDLAWAWTVVGDGPDRAALESLRDGLGLTARVRFVGAMPGAAAMRGADLVLSPSRFEGMPLVPLEAAEAGVAVLASSIDAHRELFSDAPDALLPDDEAAWPAALARLIDSPAARESLRALTSGALGDDPRGATWRAYEALYREVTR